MLYIRKFIRFGMRFNEKSVTCLVPSSTRLDVTIIQLCLVHGVHGSRDAVFHDFNASIM
jgi:hypothetical protein